MANTNLVIIETAVLIDRNTQIEGTPRVGATAEVEAIKQLIVSGRKRSGGGEQ